MIAILPHPTSFWACNDGLEFVNGRFTVNGNSTIKQIEKIDISIYVVRRWAYVHETFGGANLL